MVSVLPTPFFYLCGQDDPVKLCQFLSESSPEQRQELFNERNSFGASAIHNAFYARRIDNIKILLSYGYEIDERLTRMVACSSVEVMKILIDHGANIHLTNPLNGNTALHLASYHNQREIIKLLLDNGADINVKNKHDEIPLHMALYNTSVPTIQFLLDHGADVTILNKLGTTSLVYSIGCMAGYSCAIMILDHGADVNQRCRNGMTALHYAVLANFHDMVKLLLERGADPDILDHKDKTALIYAAERKFVSIIQLLTKT